MADDDKNRLDLIDKMKCESHPCGPAVTYNGRRFFYAYELAAAILEQDTAVFMGRR